MSSRRSPRIIGAIVAAAVILGGWVFFAPMQLGGSTTFAVTSGISMEPMLHENDLALVTTRSSYGVGDLVLYQSSTLHRSVLHRIIRIQDGNYYFQGDNNDFVDPGYATRDELVGTYWFCIPKVGSVLTWFGTPAHAALLGALTSFAIVLANAKANTSRRRRRKGSKMVTHRPPKTTGSRVEASSDPTSPARQSERSRRPAPFLDGPVSVLVALFTVASLALVLLVMGYSRPVQRPGVLADAYEQVGSFSYSATATAPNDVYASGEVKTGDPIYSSLVDTLTVDFDYEFTSTLPHDVKGTIELRTLVLSTSDNWHVASNSAPIAAFSGDEASVTTDLSLADLYRFINSVNTATGVAGANYSVDIQPVVHLTGTVGDQEVDERFSPVLPFAVSQMAIRIDAPAAVAPPGATYAPQTADSALSAVLKPTQSGGIPKLVANVLSIAKYKVPVSQLRILAVVAIVLSIVLAVAADRLRRRLPRRSEEEQIARQLKALIVPISALGSSPGHTPIAVPSFADLAGLARFLERPILYEVRDGKRIYAVDDDACRYITQARERRQARPAADQEPTEAPGPDGAERLGMEAPRQHAARVRPSRRLPGRAILARGGGAILLLAMVTTLTVSLTASTTVPASRAGRSVIAGTVAQATPAGCSSLALTSIVRGSGTFSSSASRALILGSAGVDTINSTGTFNCIVAGGGKDKVTSKSSSVCIIGPTAGSTYSTCTKKTS